MPCFAAAQARRLSFRGDLLPRCAGEEGGAGKAVRRGGLVDGRQQPGIERKIGLHGSAGFHHQGDNGQNTALGKIVPYSWVLGDPSMLRGFGRPSLLLTASSAQSCRASWALL